jgi:hypothetical protein
MSPRYQVTLTKEERKELEGITRRGKMHARSFIHARALLLCDAGPSVPAWNVDDVATAYWPIKPLSCVLLNPYRT